MLKPSFKINLIFGYNPCLLWSTPLWQGELFRADRAASPLHGLAGVPIFLGKMPKLPHCRGSDGSLPPLLRFWVAFMERLCIIACPNI